MRLVKPSFEIMSIPDGVDALKMIEAAGRTCYKSEDRITDDSAVKFVRMIVHDVKHLSVIEHVGATVRFVIDRGVSHELVRHRLCAFSQESTRYCNYGKADEVSFVIPEWLADSVAPGQYDHAPATLPKDGLSWFDAMLHAERIYLHLVDKNGAAWSPQKARSVLPNSLKTEIVTTANFREWRHIFNLRTAAAAHPQIREVMTPLRDEFRRRIPVVFDD